MPKPSYRKKHTGPRYREVRKDNDKDDNNNTVLKSIHEFLGTDIGNGIVLDGSANKTAKILVGGGIGSEKIYVPEIDPRTHTVHKRSKLCVPIKGSVKKFIHESDKETLQDINWTYLDYMGTVNGNKTKGTNHLNDCLKILKNTTRRRVCMNIVFCVDPWLVRFFPNGINKDMLMKYTQRSIERIIHLTDFEIMKRYEIREYRGRTRKMRMGFFSYHLIREESKDTRHSLDYCDV